MDDSGLAIISATLGGLCLRFILHQLAFGDAVDTGLIGFWEGLVVSSNLVRGSGRSRHERAGMLDTVSLGMQLLVDAFVWQSSTRVILILVWAGLAYVCLELVGETARETTTRSKHGTGSKDRKVDERGLSSNDHRRSTPRHRRHSPAEQIISSEPPYPLPATLEEEDGTILHHLAPVGQAGSRHSGSPVSSQRRRRDHQPLPVPPPRQPVISSVAPPRSVAYRSDTTEEDAFHGPHPDWPSLARAMNMPVIVRLGPAPRSGDRSHTRSVGRSETDDEEILDGTSRVWPNALPPIVSPVLEEPVIIEDPVLDSDENEATVRQSEPEGGSPPLSASGGLVQAALPDENGDLVLPQPWDGSIAPFRHDHDAPSTGDIVPLADASGLYREILPDDGVSDKDYQSDPTVPESDISKGPVLKIIRSADALREEANKHLQERDKCLLEREVALREGRSRDAFQLKMRANEAAAQALKCNQRAERRYLHANNRFRHRARQIDIHGLKPEEAVRQVDSALMGVVERGQHHLAIIVGQGQHSTGPPVLRPVLLQHFKRENIHAYVDPQNPGIVIVTI